jgi:GT2 family glycosyltransferase
MLIKSTVFETVGWLDENYFVYFEDTDFIYRCVQKGYRVYYMPELVICHKVGSSTGSYDSMFSIYYGNRNRIYFIKKHFGFGKKMVAFFYVLGTRLLKWLKYDIKQRKELMRAIRAGFIMKRDAI